MGLNTLSDPLARPREEIPRIKICGITNQADAKHAVDCGADVLGFNFYPESVRYVRPESAAEMIGGLAGLVISVGVFVNEPLERIIEIVGQTGIRVVQLHGDEDAEFVGRLRRFPDLEVIKAVRIIEESVAEDLQHYGANALLLDSYSDAARGGTGEKVDWQLAYEIGLLHSPMYLAGGLSAENVQEAVRKVRPFGVDACSRLESSPGKKDPKKVEAFIRNAKNA